MADYASLNLLRAVAAFWVLAYHCFRWGGAGRMPLPNAKMAVDLFMLISGFLMASNAVGREAREPMAHPRTWLIFWLRRFFRIAPSYYLALAAVFALSPLVVAGYHELQTLNLRHWQAGGTYDPTRMVWSAQNLALHATFVFGLLPSWSFSTMLPDWSLGLEMQFYLVLPFLVLALRRSPWIPIGLGLAAVAITALVGRLGFREPSLLLFKLQYFVAGMLMVEVIHARSTSVRMALGLAILVLVSLETHYGAELVLLPLMAAGMLALLWMEAHRMMPSRLARLLRSRAVSFAAETSYSVYLFHGLALMAGGLIIAAHSELIWSWPSRVRVLVLFVFVTVTTYPAAYLVYRAIELPGINLGRALVRRLGAVHMGAKQV